MGVILYSLICAKMPFLGLSVAEVNQNILKEEPTYEDDSAVWGEVSGECIDLLRRMLDK